MEIPSEVSQNGEEKHVRQYGIEDLFGKGYESDEEEVVESEEVGIIPACSGSIEEPVHRHRGRVPRGGKARTKLGPGLM